MSVSNQPPVKKRTSYHVKPANRETKFTKLREMACFQEVHEKLCGGYSVPELARIVQDERKEYTDVARESLIHVLKQYRASIEPGELLAHRPSSTSVFTKAAESLEKGLDELKALESLYQIQMKRVGIDLAIEEKLQKLVPTMTQEIRVAREILQTYADLKMDLGMSKRHLGQLDVDAKVLADVTGRYQKQSVAKVVADPQARRKVLGIAEKIMQLSQYAEDDEAPASDQIVDVTPDVMVAETVVAEDQTPDDGLLEDDAPLPEPDDAD